jgi:hypothetical protein
MKRIEPADFDSPWPMTVVGAPEPGTLRAQLEAVIEEAIALLDALDGDADAEPAPDRELEWEGDSAMMTPKLWGPQAPSGFSHT